MEERSVVGVRLDARVVVPLGAPGASGFDDLGLPTDQSIYAKKSCKACHGRGTYEVRRLMSLRDAEQSHGGVAMMQANAAFCTSEEETIQNISGRDRLYNRLIEKYAARNWRSDTEFCGCAQKRYQAARDFVFKSKLSAPVTDPLPVERGWLPTEVVDGPDASAGDVKEDV